MLVSNKLQRISRIRASTSFLPILEKTPIDLDFIGVLKLKGKGKIFINNLDYDLPIAVTLKNKVSLSIINPSDLTHFILIGKSIDGVLPDLSYLDNLKIVRLSNCKFHTYTHRGLNLQNKGNLSLIGNTIDVNNILVDLIESKTMNSIISLDKSNTTIDLNLIKELVSLGNKIRN